MGFETEKIMSMIRENIRREGLVSGQLNYISGYHDKITERIRSLDEIVVFGSGLHGKLVIEDLLQYGYSGIKCCCDNNKIRQGKQIKGIDIVSPDEAYKKYPDATFVVTPKGYENEILFQLNEMGVSYKKILIYNVSLANLEIL